MKATHTLPHSMQQVGRAILSVACDRYIFDHRGGEVDGKRDNIVCLVCIRIKTALKLRQEEEFTADCWCNGKQGRRFVSGGSTSI